MSVDDTTAARLSSRLTLAAGHFRRNGATITAGQMARALELAVSWAAIAHEQHVELKDLAGTSADLATVALEAVLARDDRRAREGATCAP